MTEFRPHCPLCPFHMRAAPSMQGALVVLAQHMEREHQFTLISLIVSRAYDDPGASPNWPTYHEPRPVPELECPRCHGPNDHGDECQYGRTKARAL